MDKKDKTIQTQQSIIESLEKEIEKLKEENKELQDLLEIEKEKPNEGFEKAKELIVEIEERKLELRQVIDELNNEKSLYKEKLLEIDEIKEKYKQALKDVVKGTKKEIKSSGKPKFKFGGTKA